MRCTHLIFSGIHTFGINDVERQVMRNDEMWGLTLFSACESLCSLRLGVYKKQQLPPAACPGLVKTDEAFLQQWWDPTSSLMLSKEEHLVLMVTNGSHSLWAFPSSYCTKQGNKTGLSSFKSDFQRNPSLVTHSWCQEIFQKANLNSFSPFKLPFLRPPPNEMDHGPQLCPPWYNNDLYSEKSLFFSASQ